MTLSTFCWGAPLRRTAMFFLAATLLLPSGQCSAANWTASYRNDGIIDTSGVGFSIEELSGVTYIGASPALGKHRFMAVQESNNNSATSTLVIFDVTFSKDGNITAAEAVSQIVVDESIFSGGIVSTETSVFLAHDNTGAPASSGVREYDLSTGDFLQSVTIPMVFTDNELPNLGFESLARNDDGTKMWTANESALPADGLNATTEDGTLVRILAFDVGGNTVTAGGQFAYEVEAIHEVGLSSLSGLVELVSLPDGALLALESSFAGLANPTWQSSIYEIDFTGLNGIDLIPAGKNELWVGQAGGGTGQGLEGLAVGPRLGNGKWILFGVVDDTDPLSSNTGVSLEIESSTFIPFGPETADFDEDGDVDGKDFLQWQRGFNVTSLAGLGHGDGNQDGDVDGDDEIIWEAQFGVTAPPSVTADFDEDNNIDGNDFLIWQRGLGTGTTLAEGDSDGSMSVDGVDLANWESMFGDVILPLTALQTVPEPTTLGLLLVGSLAAIAGRRRVAK